MNIISEQQKYDPWEAKQDITNIKITLHCSRYWMLSEWECENMSFPFWRIYHSRTGKSYVKYKEKEVRLESDCLIIIPPYTSFSSRIKNNHEISNESIKGVRISYGNDIEYYKSIGLCDQYFVHFNLGYPFDKVKFDIYQVELGDYWQSQIKLIEEERLTYQNTIDFHANIKISALILFALQSLPSTAWETSVIDNRIFDVMKYIDKNLSGELTNSKLSSIANLATNAFARLFRENLKCSVQQYIQKKRVESAIILLHYSEIEIEEISFKCGFYDRAHFAKFFKKHTGLAPSNYRKKIRGL